MSQTLARDRSGADHKIGIGEIGVAQGSGVMRTLLGSCVGLVLHDQAQSTGGMVHVMLPAAGNAADPPGKYADTAVPELIRQIEAVGGRSNRLIAKLAGGAKMFATERTNSIGDQNLVAIEKLLRLAGIPIVGRHCGGTYGRRMAYDVSTGDVVIEVVGQPSVEL